jgi:uncharacterized membrane protein
MLESGHGVFASRVTPRDFLCLLFLGFAVTLAAEYVSSRVPEFPPVLTASTWKVLLVTTFGLLLSATPAKKIAGSYELGIALIYLFVARMGAMADLSGLKSQALWFVLAAYLWNYAAGLVIVLGAPSSAWTFISAIASVANIGRVAGFSSSRPHNHAWSSAFSWP